METNNLLDTLFKSPIKIGPRIPEVVDKYIERKSLEEGISKYDVIYQLISQILPSFSEVVGEDIYCKFINQIQKRILNLKFDSNLEYCSIINSLFLCKDNVKIIRNLIDFAFYDLDTVEKHSLVRLLNFKREFITEIINDTLSDKNIKEKYNKSFQMIGKENLIMKSDKLKAIIELDRIEKESFFDKSYNTYREVVENHCKAYKKMKSDYIEQKDEYNDFSEFRDNNDTSYEGFIWTNYDVDLDLAKNIKNIGYIFKTIDEANESYGGIDSSEDLIAMFKEQYFLNIEEIENDEIKKLLKDLLVNFYIPYLQNDTEEKENLYEKQYNQTFDKISDLL